MSRRHLLMLAALAAIWGSSFMFITIALRDLSPSTLILLRMGSGALALGVRAPGRPPLVSGFAPTPEPIRSRISVDGDRSRKAIVMRAPTPDRRERRQAWEEVAAAHAFSQRGCCL